MQNELPNLLAKECARLESEAVELREQIKTDSSRLRYVEGQLVHVRALLQQDVDAGGPDSIRLPYADNPNGPVPSVCDIAAEVLRERGREPMYYKDLTEEVIRRGGVLNGKTPEATLTARMVRDDRFIRPTSKGFYALRADYPNARNVGARHRSGRRRE